MEQKCSNKDYAAGDLIESTAIGLRGFEYNTLGTLGILIEVIGTREAAKVWWFGSNKLSTVLFSNFRLLSRTTKSN